MATALQLRRDIATLADLAAGDLATLRRLADVESVEALRDLLPGLVVAYGAAAATIAADWYDELREEAATARKFTATPIEASDRGSQALIGWALDTATTDDALWELLDGGMQRRIADHSRLTIIGSSYADPSSAGWKRIGSGACAFCRMLIERDELYSEATADFASHDNCNCSAYPLIKGAEPIDVKDYVRGPRNDPDSSRYKADYARAREWIADHPTK